MARERLLGATRSLRIPPGLVALTGITLLLLLLNYLPLNDPFESVGPVLAEPSLGLPGGTDELGRDVLARTLEGMTTTWLAVWPMIVVGVVVGGSLGMLGGLGPAWLMTSIMRITDVFLALPATLITIAVAIALGGGLRNTLVAMSITFWPPYARIVGAELRSVRGALHVEAARFGGVPPSRVLFLHVLPACVRPVAIQATLDVPVVIMTLAALSFLGLGAAPPNPELGAMTARGLPYVLDSWWVPTVPAFGVLLLSVSAALIGDRLSDTIQKHRA